MRGARGEQERARRRAVGALAAAFFAHALLLFLAWRIPEPPAHSDAITVEIRTVERATPPEPAPAPAKPSPGERTAKRLKASLRPDLPVSPNAGGAGSGRGGIAPLARTDLPENEPIPSAPPAEPQTPPGPAAPEPERVPEVQLFPDDALRQGRERWMAEHGEGNGGGLGGSGRGVGSAPGDGAGTGEGDGEGPGAEKARVTERIARDIADFQAKDRVEVGLVDPYFRDLRWGMKDAWKPKASDLGGFDGDGPLAGLGNLLKGWNAVGKQYAKSGTPYADGEKPEGLVARSEEKRAAGGTSGFDAGDFMARWNAGELGFPGSAVVLQLTQAPDGSPLDVKVLVSSGTRVFDLRASDAVRVVAKERIPPTHGLGLGGPRITSVWKLEAKLVPKTCGFMPDSTGGLPPPPTGGLNQGSGISQGIMCGGTFDMATGEVDPDLPLTTKIITKISLVAVYGGETGPHGD